MMIFSRTSLRTCRARDCVFTLPSAFDTKSKKRDGARQSLREGGSVRPLMCWFLRVILSERSVKTQSLARHTISHG